MLVGPRTGASERIVLAHYAATRPGCVWWGNVALTRFVRSGSWGGELGSLMT